MFFKQIYFNWVPMYRQLRNAFTSTLEDLIVKNIGTMQDAGETGVIGQSKGTCEEIFRDVDNSIIS